MKILLQVQVAVLTHVVLTLVVHVLAVVGLDLRSPQTAAKLQTHTKKKKRKENTSKANTKNLKKKRSVCKKWKNDFGWVEVRKGLIFMSTQLGAKTSLGVA